MTPTSVSEHTPACGEPDKDDNAAQLTNIPRDALLEAGAHVTFDTTVEAVEWLQQRLISTAAM